MSLKYNSQTSSNPNILTDVFSWVMLHPNEGFVRLPNERVVYISPNRTTLSLQTPNKYPGRNPLSIQSSAGKLYLTNQRIIYLPSNQTEQLQSFSAPLLNLHDTHISAPFFGPNSWNAILQPVPGGGIPPNHSAVELKFVFKDGGAYDFHNDFERLKERTQQAVEVARESGQITGDGSETGAGRGGAYSALNFGNIDLEELPAYEARDSHPAETGPSLGAPPDSVISGTNSTPQAPINEVSSPTQPRDTSPNHPSGPPPGYEEVQSSSIADELERRLRRDST
ncbi:MAG: hypothetical protein M1834_002933 [Cirrosporium novae-zelandiae]|nr:MAG: hypothetical protein M1834_002933 [Cirrosporium novae-zelandiae]